MAKKLKVGQAVGAKPPSDDEIRARENRTFVVVIIVIPTIMAIAIFLVSYFKLLG